MNRTTIFSIIIVLITFALGGYLYPMMPDKMASHWNAAGEVDGYMSKSMGVFLLPLISLTMLCLFIVIPLIDPLNRNIDKFRNHFDSFVALILIFMLYLYALTILWNYGYRFNMMQMLMPAFAVLFFFAGVLIKNAKRNYSIGIRTPWTLASEKVWDKTHRLGGILFQVSALICLLGMLVPSQAIWFMLAPIIMFTLFLFVYSYIEFRREKK